jgi:hypothetical protein
LTSRWPSARRGLKSGDFVSWTGLSQVRRIPVMASERSVKPGPISKHAVGGTVRVRFHLRPNTGISSMRGSAAHRRQQKRAPYQTFTGQFPTPVNREFFAALQGIISGDQGIFRPDQGIRLSTAIWHLIRRQIRSSQEISSLAKRRKGAARCSKLPQYRVRRAHPASPARCARWSPACRGF